MKDKNILKEIEEIKKRIDESETKKPAGLELRRILKECSTKEYIKKKLEESTKDCK